MVARVLLLLVLLAAGASAGCGAKAPKPDPGEIDREALEEAARSFTTVVRSKEPPYSVAFPKGWKRESSAQPPAPVRLRHGRRSCLVGPAGPLPDLAKEDAMLAFVRDPPLEGATLPEPIEVRPEEGADADGATAVRSAGPARLSFTVLVQSGGRGVSVTCEVPRRERATFDRRVFRPLVTTIRLHADARLARLQRSVLVVPGIERAGFSPVARRGRPSVQGNLELDSSLRTRAQTEQALARALLTSGEALPNEVLVLLGRDARRRQVFAARRPGARGYVQVLPGRARRFADQEQLEAIAGPSLDARAAPEGETSAP